MNRKLFLKSLSIVFADESFVVTGCEPLQNRHDGYIEYSTSAQNGRYSQSTSRVIRCNFNRHRYPDEDIYRYCDLTIWTGSFGDQQCKSIN